MKHYLISCVLLATAGLAQVSVPQTSHCAIDPAHTQPAAWPFTHVLHDVVGDSAQWARGRTWKARFDRRGFAYLPFFADAPRNFPVQFRLAVVRVGETNLPFATDVMPRRDGDRITFERGAVSERYDLDLHQVEQTFVVDTAMSGDIELELTVVTELTRDAAAPGIRFGGPFGEVVYGDAFVVRGQDRTAISTVWTGETIRLHVPAALRGDGPVVIDPIITTVGSTTTGALSSPDVAYDATNGRFLVVWESTFSEFDHDVYCEMFDAHGNPIPGSGAAIDATSTYVEHPRVANLDHADRFLVVTSVADPLFGNRQMIYGRTRDAGGSMTVHPAALLSDPALPGNNYIPAVGTDPGTGAGNHDWLVVWGNSISGTQAGIQGRLVQGNGTVRSPSVLPIREVTGERNWQVRVSRSNGNGSVTRPQWLVVWASSTTPANGDIWCRPVDPQGAMGSPHSLDPVPDDDRYPDVSSPVDVGGGSTRFLVTCQHPGAMVGYHIRITAANVFINQRVLLDQSFGAGRFDSRIDSDGLRYLLITSHVGPSSSTPNTVTVQTLAPTSTNLTQAESPRQLPTRIRDLGVVALHSSGGTPGEFAIAHLEPAGFLVRPVLTRYAGRVPGPEMTVVATACNGIAIQASGSTVPGNSLQFTLSNHGTDLPAFVIGWPNVTPVPICPSCLIGVRQDMPMQSLFGSPTMTFAIPRWIGLVGLSLAVQGASLGAGSCLGGLSVSDTIQFTIR